MDPNSQTPVKYFSAQLNLPNKTGKNVGWNHDLNAVKQECNRAMGGGGDCRFEGYGSTGGGGTMLIFHTSAEGGKKAIGWLATIEVPGYLGAALIENREKVAA